MRVHHAAISIVLLFLSAILLTFDFSSGLSSRPPIPEVIGLILMIFYLHRLHLKASGYFYTSFYQIYSSLGVLVSLIFIIAGHEMLEVQSWGTANGAYWFVYIFLIVGVEAGKLGYFLADQTPSFRLSKLSQEASSWLVLTICCVVLAIGFMIFILYGGAARYSGTRVAFWTSEVPGVLRLYPSLLGQTFFLAAFLFLSARAKGKNTLIYWAIVFLYLLATAVVSGERFSGFVFYATVWLAVVAGIYNGVVLRGKHLVYGSIFLIFLLAIVAFSYARLGMGASFIFSRIAMQGQLSWSVLNESAEVIFFGDRSACIYICSSGVTGAEYISGKYLPYGLWQSYQITGSGLTGFMPALPILAFGAPLALGLHAAISFGFGALQSVLVSRIRSGDLVGSLLIFKIFFGLLVLWYAAKLIALPGILVSLCMLFAWYCYSFFQRKSSFPKVSSGVFRRSM